VLVITDGAAGLVSAVDTPSLPLYASAVWSTEAGTN